MNKLGRLHLAPCLLGIVALVLATAGCGSTGDEKENSGELKVLSAKEAKKLLRQLPYRYTFRAVVTPKGADAAVAGQAIGPHDTRLNFGIALGHGNHGVPIPRAGTAELYGYPDGGFIFTTDEFIGGPDGRMIPNPRLHSAAQWSQVSHMSVSMTDKLCLAATREHCPP